MSRRRIVATVLAATLLGLGGGPARADEREARFEAEKHWALQPVRDVPLPQVDDESWVKSSIDRFIRSRQQAAGVRPSAAADRRTLIRRATFDLTGLPPTPQEVAAFLADPSPRAFDTVIDRLLDSPRYGERWGRHWLDVVRYADTAGETADYPVPLAWKYRNYVIDAFNADKPYDEFLREQIAGDLLAERGPRDRYAERVTATGYLAISRRFGFDSENYQHLTIQDTIDTLGQSVLGLSLGCARCHDHKFDAVSMRDYYALYGIFASSRYPFPGSEQKQRVRSLVPLVPRVESQRLWRAYATRVAELAGELAKQQQAVPAALLRSLHDIDGDFELQAPAAGGSNGVLVAPWLYSGNVAVTAAAQSPFKNLYDSGKTGASVPAGNGGYQIHQAIHPRRSRGHSDIVHVNLDFRVAARDVHTPGVHHFVLGSAASAPAAHVLIASHSVALKLNDTIEELAPLNPNQWHNLQLTLDLKRQSVSGRIGTPHSTVEFHNKPLHPAWSGTIDHVAFQSMGQPETKYPAIEWDNLGIQDSLIAPVSTEFPVAAAGANEPDWTALTEQLQAIAGFDGDLELQSNDAPPSRPWNPGPNSAVKVSGQSQSPFCNVYPAGQLGVHMPNRAAYDGFGLTLKNVRPDPDGRLFVGFDFRCANQDAGGNGSWRYYLGHGPGHSALIELYFNGNEFFARSGDAKQSIGPLAIGEWHQVQLTLDLNARSYTGRLASRTGHTDFAGRFASGWDGTIDYSFIDSYGHIAGVRPSLDADNFALADQPLPPLDAPPVAAESHTARREQIDAIRRQLAALQTVADQKKQELARLLATGPFAMTFGMAEGTPHNARMQMRGEPDQLGPEVPRGFIALLGGQLVETAGSGRLELANWLTRPENPLTARVMVNRIWQFHFGHGLVKTPNDFGTRGLPPTHPELLDHLAAQFIRGGWSVKAMHRRIMQSATYQQSSIAESQRTEGDADRSDLYSTFQRRRLSAEEVRDAILAVSGELDATAAEEHPFPPPTNWGYTQHAPFSAVYGHQKRSVYLMTQRLKRHPFLALFDGADPNATTATRLTTTVPTQALYFLNDPFVHASAFQWANRLLRVREPERIDAAWQAAVGRPAHEVEREEAAAFLAAYRAELEAAGMDGVEARALAAYLRTLLGSNEFLHVD